jgi:hypothetical protein
MVGIISLSEREGSLEELVRAALSDGAASVVVAPASSHSTTRSVVTVSYGKSSRIAVSLLTNSTSFRDQYAPAYGDDDASVQGALDLCRVCDLVLFVIDGKCVDDVAVGGGGGSGGGSVSGASTTTTDTNDRWDHLISERGERVLTAIKAQGLPTPVTVVVHPGGGGGGDDDDDDDDAGNRPIVGRRVGATADDDGDEDGAMMDDDEEDEEEDEEEVEMNDAGGASSFVRGSVTTPPRSARSIRKTRLRRRSELRRYVARLAAAEFGERGGKVAEIDVGGPRPSRGKKDGGERGRRPPRWLFRRFRRDLHHRHDGGDGDDGRIAAGRRERVRRGAREAGVHDLRVRSELGVRRAPAVPRHRRLRLPPPPLLLLLLLLVVAIVVAFVRRAGGGSIRSAHA